MTRQRIADAIDAPWNEPYEPNREPFSLRAADAVLALLCDVGTVTVRREDLAAAADIVGAVADASFTDFESSEPADTTTRALEVRLRASLEGTTTP